ncbi:MAG: formylmethanofuran dehydrogenase [Planctomycetes bacterium]|nr:formylmethanofuran dehydrogenase [Planctomycetota bacterium]
MPEVFVLIPGRTSRQGTSINEGKDSPEYRDEVGTLIMSPEDMARLGIPEGGRVRLSTRQGQIELPCKTARKGELQAGVLFMAYGPWSSRLMGGDTHGTGMPDSKAFDVELEKMS